MNEDPYFYHPLENIEDIDTFEEAVDRIKLTRMLSPERPYTYWSLEYYDAENGIRGGGGLGILAADTRRVADEMHVPMVLITPFYPMEAHQKLVDGELVDELAPVDYHDFGFKLIDSVNIKCNDTLCKLDVVSKKFGSTRLICITEPNFRELYAGLSSSDHRLYQEVSLGFGGYQALKLMGFKPSVIHLNEVATFFAALARLDELTSNGMDFYEAVVYTRKHTLYTNHTLVQAAEAEYELAQFERYVFPNLKSRAVRRWLQDKFENGRIKLSSITIEIAELRSGVSKLHVRVADYHDVAGNKVKFRPITNGIDLKRWVMPEILHWYHEQEVVDAVGLPMVNYAENLDFLTAADIREFKRQGREILNTELAMRPGQNGEILSFRPDDFIFVFKRRFVDYKRPELVFSDPARLRAVLEAKDAHFILTGRLHTGDTAMSGKLKRILDVVQRDEYLKTHVHYLADYDEKLAFGLSVGCNAAVNTPVVGLEACGTSWMKDVANLDILISTNDGGVADVGADYHLDINAVEFVDEVDAAYKQMARAMEIYENDFDLEYTIIKQLIGYLPIISGARMVNEYLDFLFPVPVNVGDLEG